MKPKNSKALALIFSACFLFMSAFSYAQLKTDREEGHISARPAIPKGYYSIYNNAEKLNPSINRKTSVNEEAGIKPGSSISFAPQKGYYSRGRNAEKKIDQMAKESFGLQSKTSSGTIQNTTWPVINKGYYSIGKNAGKLHQ